MRLISMLVLGVSCAFAHADSAPLDYVSKHPDHVYEQNMTQTQASAEQFFKQFRQLRGLLDQDLADVQNDAVADEANYWVCVRIQQLHTLFDNNQQHRAAFNRRFTDMDFDTLMGYWHSDIESRREICYQSEVSYSDRP